MKPQKRSFESTIDIDSRSAKKGASLQPGKPRKVPVALRFDVELLAAIDAMATRRGMSRNAIISYWCSKGVESE